MKVVCFGDSNTYGFDSRSYFGSRYSAENRWVDILAKRTGWTIYNEGMNGREVPQQGIILPHDIDLLIIMLGTNDILQGRNPNEIQKRMEDFLKETHSNNILLIAPPVLQIGEWVYDHTFIDASAQLPQLYCALAEKYGIAFVDAGNWNVDLLYDGVHFSEKGHREFANGLYNYFIDSGIGSDI